MARIKTILVCDDNMDILKLASDILRSEGFSVITTSKGKEVLEYIRRPGITIDLVVLDIKMPDIHGIQIIHDMKQQSVTVPVIVFTAYPEMRDIPDFQTQGVYAIVLKMTGRGLLTKSRKFLKCEHTLRL